MALRGGLNHRYVSSDYCRSIRRFGTCYSWQKIYLVSSVRVKTEHRIGLMHRGPTPDRSAIIDEKITDRLTVLVDVAVKQA